MPPATAPAPIAISEAALATLSDNEAAVLRILLDPDHAGKPTRTKCRLAGVSHDTWYTVLKRPHFQQARQEAVRTFLGEGVVDVLHTVHRKAVGGDIVAARLYLQCAGMLDERVRVEATVQHSTADVTRAQVEAFGALTAEEGAVLRGIRDRILRAQTPVDAAGAVEGDARAA